MNIFLHRALTSVLSMLSMMVAVTVSAASATPLKYEKFAFERAVTAGGPVIVHFSAGWCPVCQAQKPVVLQVLQEPSMHSVKLFVADYDRELLLKGALNIKQQSTFVVFKDGSEVTRTTGQTSRNDIRATFRKALVRDESLDAADAAASTRAGKRAPAASAPDRGPAADTPFTPFSTNLGKRP
jgi:thioredoxin 1